MGVAPGIFAGEVVIPPHSAYAWGKFKIPAPRAELTSMGSQGNKWLFVWLL